MNLNAAASLLSALAAPLLLLAWSKREKARVARLLACALTALYGGLALKTALHNVAQPGEWDFVAFRLYAGVARAGANFYVPSALSQHAGSQASAEFRNEVLAVGFPYPPPSMFLFLPLAAVANVRTALVLWYVVQFAALVAAAIILQRVLLARAGPAAAVFFGALALLSGAALETVANAQTNFIALFLCALALGERRRARGAVWAALAVFVKPYALTLLLAEFAQPRARRAIVYAATLAAAFAAALAAFGGTTVATYFTSNPASRAPGSSFVEAPNQSLLAELLRATRANPAHVSLAHEAPFIVLAAGLLALTAWLAMRLGRDDDDLAFAAALTVGLLVYPAALGSYAVVLVIPLAILWLRCDVLARGAQAVAALSGAVYLLMAVHHSFWAVALVWTALATVAFCRGARYGDVPSAARSDPTTTLLG